MCDLCSQDAGKLASVDSTYPQSHPIIVGELQVACPCCFVGCLGVSVYVRASDERASVEARLWTRGNMEGAVFRTQVRRASL